MNKQKERWNKIKESKWECQWCNTTQSVKKDDLMWFQLGDRMASDLFANCTKCKILRMMEPMDVDSKFLSSKMHKRGYFKLEGSTNGKYFKSLRGNLEKD